ncbi:pyridoxamine phosphate oxidase family protein [Trichoderma velutinum]
MVHYYESLTEDLREWALQQKVFFTASAPLRGRHINVSPKGLLDATFHIFDPNHAAYMDSIGTGIETISHIYENNRITLMFCSLDEKPRIMRLFCTGTVVERTDPKFPDLITSMGKKELPAIRAIIMLDIWKVRFYLGALLYYKKNPDPLTLGTNLLRLRSTSP